MSRLVRIAAVVCLAGPLGGCVLPLTTGSVPYPVHSNPVNPEPARGYVVQCVTDRGYFNRLFDDQYSACRQLIVPAEPVLAVRG